MLEIVEVQVWSAESSVSCPKYLICNILPSAWEPGGPTSLLLREMHQVKFLK